VQSVQVIQPQVVGGVAAPVERGSPEVAHRRAGVLHHGGVVPAHGVQSIHGPLETTRGDTPEIQGIHYEGKDAHAVSVCSECSPITYVPF